jgi:hypothetical protein
VIAEVTHWLSIRFAPWQTLIASLVALGAAWWTVRATRSTAKDQIDTARKQTETTIRLEQERVFGELDALRKSLAVELRLQIARAFGAYDGLQGLSRKSDGAISARMVESKSRMAAPIIYPANAGKIGLLGADAMDVVIVYDLLEIARDGAARLMTYRTPDDISPAVVMGTAKAFLAACDHARGVLPKLRTGDPSRDAKDEALIQQITNAVALSK